MCPAQKNTMRFKSRLEMQGRGRAMTPLERPYAEVAPSGIAPLALRLFESKLLAAVELPPKTGHARRPSLGSADTPLATSFSSPCVGHSRCNPRTMQPVAP